MTWNSSVSCFTVFLCCSFWHSAVVSAGTREVATDYGVLELVVLDTYGAPLRSFEVEIASESAPDVRRRASPKTGAMKLPYGTYVIRGNASLHHGIEHRFVLHEPRLLLTIALPFRDPGESPWVYAPPLKVRIQNAPSNTGRLWVRLLSLFGTFTKEATVEQSGEVSVNEIPYGDYLVLVFQDSRLLKTTRYRRTVKDHECSIKLGGDANSPQHPVH